MTDRHNWILGASTCTLGRIDSYSYEEGFRAYHDAGINHCELTLWPTNMEKLDFIEHPEKLAGIINGAGVEIYSMHLPFTDGVTLSSPEEKQTRDSIDMMKKTLRAAAKIGAKIAVIHPAAGHFDEWKNREKLLEHSIKCVREVCEYANELGIKAAVENLPRQGLGRVPHEIIAYLTQIPSLGMCFDLNHSLLQSNEDYFNELIKAGMHGRIYHIHVSDYDMADEKHWLPGKGINDWEMILSKLEELDYNGAFMYEINASNATPGEIVENFKMLIADK